MLQPVRDEQERWALGRRVSEEQGAAFEQAASTGTTPAGHLRTAWRACFRRDAEPATAYREAVLAVEGAAGAVLLPADTKPSLGKAVAHLVQSQDCWTVAGLDRNASDSDATLVAMLQTLQRNDRRHAGPGDAASDPVTQDEAETVVFLAVTLLRWFEQGLVRKRAAT